MPRVATFEALENSVVLAVHRKNAPTVVSRGGHNHLAGHDENLFAGQGNVLPRLERRERGTQSARAHDGHQHHVRARP